TFAQNFQRAIAPIDVFHAGTQDFGDSAARRPQEVNQQAVPGVIRRGEQLLDLCDGEPMRKTSGHLATRHQARRRGLHGADELGKLEERAQRIQALPHRVSRRAAHVQEVQIFRDLEPGDVGHAKAESEGEEVFDGHAVRCNCVRGITRGSEVREELREELSILLVMVESAFFAQSASGHVSSPLLFWPTRREGGTSRLIFGKSAIPSWKLPWRLTSLCELGARSAETLRALLFRGHSVYAPFQEKQLFSVEHCRSLSPARSPFLQVSCIFIDIRFSRRRY